MNALLKYLSLILGIIMVNTTYSQPFNDTVFTKNNDTILCQITLVNDHNIFYNYKKKRRTKAADISRKDVLSYKSDNPKLLKLIKRPRFPKCDTCRNWMVFNTGDTAYYEITPLYLKDDSRLIVHLSLKNNNSLTTVNIPDINALFYNDIFYRRVTFTKLERMPLYENSHALKISQEHFLSYAIVKGKLDLNIFNYFVNSDGMMFGEATVGVLFGVVAGSIVLNESIKRRFQLAYFIEKEKNKIVVPKSNEKFIEFVETHLSDRQDIVAKVKSKELKYSDIEKIFKLYNK